MEDDDGEGYETYSEEDCSDEEENAKKKDDKMKEWTVYNYY